MRTILSLLLLAAPVVAAQSPAAPTRLPESPVGQVAAEFLRAINGGDSLSRDFARRREAEDPMDQRSLDEVVAMHAQIRERTGGLELLEIVRATPTRIEWRLRGRTSRRLLAGVIEVRQLEGGEWRVVDIGLRPTDPTVPSGPSLDVTARRTALATYASAIGRFGFSGAMLVARRGEVILRHASGQADRSRTIPNRPETVFSLGSLAKQFTGAAILKLEEEGRLRTTDSIGRFFPNAPADKRGITLHHLLTHTSGLSGGPGGGVAPDRDAEVRAILERPLTSPIGARMRYANEGYTLLGAVVEIAAGVPLERYLRERLWSPAGMSATGITTAPAWPGTTLARYYVGTQDNGTPLDRPQPNWRTLGSGGVLSTLDDMLRWHGAMHDDRVLSAASRAKLFTPSAQGYAYGWSVRQSPWGTEVAHDGGNTLGVGADMRFYPDSQIVVIAFANDDGEATLLGSVRERLRSLAMGQAIALPAVPAVARPSDLQAHAGSYRLSSADVIDIVAEGLGLALRPRGQQASALVWGGAPDDPTARAANERTRRVLEAGMRGDSATIRALLPERVRLPSLLAEWRRELTARLGDFQHVEVLGTHPGSSGAPAERPTEARLHFARGTTDVLFVWEGDDLAMFNRSPQRAAQFVALEEGGFGRYDFATGEVTRISFVGSTLVIRDARAAR